MPFPRLLATVAFCALALSAAAAEPARFRISTSTPAEKSAARSLGQVQEDYGNFVIVTADDTQAVALRSSVGNASGLAIEPLDFTIGLRSFKFDPQSAQPARSSEWSGPAARPAAASEGDYYLVQFHAPIRPEWLAELRTLGAEPVQYIPNQAYLVHARPTAMEAVSRHAKVRWTGAYEPLYRVSPQLQWAFRADAEKAPSADGTYLVGIYRRAEARSAESALAKFGQIVSVDRPSGGVFHLYRVALAPEHLAAVAALRDVYSLEPHVARIAEDERGSQILAGNYTGTAIGNLNPPGYDPLTQFGTNGAGVSVAVVDTGIQIPGPSGFYITAARAVSGPLRGASGTAFLGGHGHLCGAIIGGDSPFPATPDPLGYNYGRGVAPGVNLVSIPAVLETSTSIDSDTADDAVRTIPPNGVRSTISNNSWGAGVGVDYTSREAMYDSFVRDGSVGGGVDPLLLVFSAGNNGPGAQTLTRPHAAKNILTVGSSVGLRPELPAAQGVNNVNLDYMSNFSSRGPAQDGRIKPDLCAPGQQITGPRTTSNGNAFAAVSGDPVHIYSAGTSFAAPHASGAAALFAGWWKSQHGGANPSPALVKAALINGTVDMNAEQAGVAGSSSLAPVPNSVEGWGRINLSKSVNTGLPTHYVDQNVILASLASSYTYSGTVSSAAAPLRITLAWTDVPGAAGANPAMVNDLDLVVTVGANIYRGNVFTAGTSTPGGSADRRNNVENVFITGLPAGTGFTVQVLPAALNGNGAVGTAGNNQDFALVVQNVVPATSCPAIDFQPASIPTNVTTGYVYPTQNFSNTGGVGPVTTTVLGGFPAGMTFSNGILSGTPTSPGTYEFVLNAVDANGCFGSRAYSFTVLSPSLQRGTVTVTSGNALLEPSECNTLNIGLSNSGNATATAVSATLTSSTPGIIIPAGAIAYANLAPGGSGLNLTPFLVGTDGSIPCFTNASFTLTVTSIENAPVVYNFTLPIGQAFPNYVISPAGTGSIPTTGGNFITGSRDDDAVVTIPIPADFSFTVYGLAVPGGSSIRASTNGTLQFDSTGGSRGYTNGNLPVISSDTGTGSFPATKPTLFPFWDDLNLAAGTNGIYTYLTGTAPNRTFTVEWKGIAFNTNTAVNFAVQLHEGSSVFEFVYNNSAASNGSGATIGSQAANTGSIFTQYSVNTAGTYTGFAVLRGALPTNICSPGGGPCNTAPAFTSSLPAGPVIVGSPYAHQFTASGQPVPTFALTAGTLPPGLTLSASGSLSGTATAGGNGTFAGLTVTASNGLAPDATQSFTLTTATRASNYFASYGLTGPAADPLLDFDLDGLSNLLEYAFNLNPAASSVSPLETRVRDYAGTSYLSIRFPRSTLATDLTYIVEVTSDLGANPIVWTELARSTAGAVTTGVGFVSETGTAPLVTVEVRDTVPVPTVGQPHRFVRVRVQ